MFRLHVVACSTEHKYHSFNGTYHSSALLRRFPSYDRGTLQVPRVQWYQGRCVSCASFAPELLLKLALEAKNGLLPSFGVHVA